jgi:UDP-glucose:(heptosyl)LPS alpha-1,3-glucosyltransferase
VRIALVLERFDSQGGGLEQWAWQLAHELTRRGHSLTAVAFRQTEASPTPIDVCLLDWQESRLARARAVDSALAKIGADVVHDLGVGWSADVLQPQMGCRLANYRRERQTLSATRRLSSSIRPHQRRWLGELSQLEQRQYRQTSCLVVAVSRMVARDLSEFYSVKPERIRVIPNGVDNERYSPATPEVRESVRKQFDLVDKTVFLFAAHNPRLKGLRPLLKAFAKPITERPDLRLVVLGKEPDLDSVDFVRTQRLADAVIFAGFVNDTAPWFAAADAFVLPTYYDACSLTVLEACACGLPVITTRHNGAAELLTSGREGRVIQQADDTGALTEALIELADPAVRARMRLHTLALASRCTFERNVDELENVYMEIGERSNLRRRNA